VKARFAISALLAIAALLLPACAGAGAATVHLQHVGDFASPVYVTQPPNGGPLLVVEQGGTIRAVSGGSVLSRPFVDLRSRVLSGGERGLLSVAFPPNYRRSKLLYVYYTNKKGDIEIDEFHRGRSPNRARASSRRKVLAVRHREFENHNGGQLQFDRRGRLYIGTGDGGGGGDPHGHAQSKRSLLGKLLRIDPRKHGALAYRVPHSNPYVGRRGLDEIYAIGLRNPWRFSFDTVGTTQYIAIGDVGQGRQEEVDYETLAGARGANFGWNRFEGFLTYPGGSLASSQPDPPIFAYDHGGPICSDTMGCAIAGGYVVRDPSLPALAGRYVYADTYEGNLRSFVPSNAPATDSSLGQHVPFISSFGRDTAGHIFVASLNGPVFRLVP
jgi:hypothetical protein